VARPLLQVIVASTRPGRVGPAFARWFVLRAEKHGEFDVEVVDLAEVNLPFMDEPHHPRLRQYTHEHTRRWSATIDAADAFVLVMPEYNHGFTAPLKNAIDYLVHEWTYKPVGFVTYGGVAAGTRAQQLLKPVLVGLKMTPIVEAVNIPFVSQLIKDGQLEPTESLTRAGHTMLIELERYEQALRPLRQASRHPLPAH
jgi:NAD(P)H-dependent FMN reductase